MKRTLSEQRQPRLAAGTVQEVTDRHEAARVLEQGQALLRVASQLSRLGAWRVDLPSGTLQCSEEVRAIFEAGPGQVLSLEEAFALCIPEYRQRVREMFAACARDGTPYDVEVAIVTCRGRRAWVRTLGEAVRDATGAVVAVCGAVQDVTERRAADQAMATSEERFRLLASATNDAVYDYDLLTGALWWGEGFESLFGYQRDDVGPTRELWARRVHEADRARVARGVGEAIAAGRSHWEGQYRFQRRDGTYAHVRDRCHILYDEGGRALRVIGGMTDLTERRETEWRLAQQGALLDAAHEAILVHDMRDRVVYWNKGAERAFGWSRTEAEGRAAAELFSADPGLYGEARTALFREGQWEGELALCARDGSLRTVAVRWTLVRDEQEEPHSILAITQDVTDQKRLEAEALRAQRLESLGTLAGGIAHDLNNVLAPIMVAIDLLRDGDTDPARLECLDTIAASAQRGADMVRQVLSFARGAEGERVPVDPAAISRDVVKIIRETFPKDVSVRLEAPPSLARVLGDPTQLHQVLMNLCVNARDAMPGGGALTLRLSDAVVDEVFAGMKPGASPGPHVVLSVTDTGTGLSRAARERLFEPFFTTKELGKGTGLGLSTVHTIVRAHGGFVDVHSEAGKGARFAVYLPALVEKPDALAPADRRPGHLPRGQGELVLVIEDEEALRVSLQRTLERFGYRVLLAGNGAEGVSAYVHHRDQVAVVLIDMSMPVLDGPAAIAALRAIDPGVRVIGTSGLMSNSELAGTLGRGLRHFVPKPYTADLLLTTLRRALHEVH